MKIKLIMILVIIFLVLSCGNDETNIKIKTITLNPAGTASYMNITAGREGFWKLVDSDAIENNTFEKKELILFNKGEYELPAISENMYQIVMEALDIDEVPIARGVSKVIDVDNLEDKSEYYIYMAPLNESVSITSLETGFGDNIKNIEGHTVTALPDGRVLVFAGKDATGYTSEAYIYSPDKQTAALLSTNGIKRAFHNSTVFYTDVAKTHPRVLISGGKSDAGYIGTSEVFNPENNTVTQVNDQLLAQKSNQAAVLAPNGMIYLFGGETADGFSNEILAFNTYNNIYSKLPVTLSVALGNTTATYIGGGKIIIAGGNDADNVYNKVYVFDTNSNSISDLGTMSSKRTMHKAVMYNGKVYFIGGFSSILAKELSAPVSSIDQADSTKVLNSLCSLNKARGRFITNFVNVNTIIVAGGDNSDRVPIKSSEIIELKSQSCTVSTRKIDLNVPRHSSESVLTSNGLTIIVGGTSSGVLTDATPVEAIAVDPRYLK